MPKYSLNFWPGKIDAVLAEQGVGTEEVRMNL